MVEERDVLIGNVIVSVKRYDKFVDGTMESWEGWDWIWSCKEGHGSCKVVEGEGHASADVSGHSDRFQGASTLSVPCAGRWCLRRESFELGMMLARPACQSTREDGSSCAFKVERQCVP